MDWGAIFHGWSLPSLGPVDGSFRLYLYVVLINLSLSSLHKFLDWLAPKTKCVWDDKINAAIEYTLTLLEWAMGARRRRDEKTATEESKPN